MQTIGFGRGVHYWTLLGLLIGCGGEVGGSVVFSDDGEDEEGPEIEHAEIDEPQTYGHDVLIEAIATDPSGVIAMEVVYRQETDAEWSQQQLAPVGDGLYQGAVAGAQIGSGKMWYYLTATDAAATPNTSCLPEDCEADAFSFAVVPD